MEQITLAGQAGLWLLAVELGGKLAAGYSLGNGVRWLLLGRRLQNTFDLGYWLFCAGAVWLFLLRENQGQPRFYALAGLCAGWALWRGFLALGPVKKVARRGRYALQRGRKVLYNLLRRDRCLAAKSREGGPANGRA